MASDFQFRGEVVGLEQSIERALRRQKPIRIQVDDRASAPLGRITGRAGEFGKAIDAATDRVVAFGAAAGAFRLVETAITSLVRSTIEVEAALARININLNESSDGLSKFSKDLFNVARQTGQTFKETAKAAEELARQGLGSQQTLVRLKDALILSRLAAIDSNEAVDALTASINSFSKEALDSTQIINKLAAVDARFAVSTKDLAQAISRVGSSAVDAGVSFDELIALVTSAQQTTARGGAVIGNSLKTIFTRLQRSDTLEQLERLGVAVRNTKGDVLPATEILKGLASAYDGLGQSSKSSIAELVGGVYQINILKSLFGDLSKETSVYQRALGVAVNAQDEAFRKNDALNKTLQATINQTTESVKQLFAEFGQINFNGLLGGLLQSFNKVIQFLSGAEGENLGETLGKSLLQGISNVITGPGFLITLGLFSKLVGRIGAKLANEFRDLLTINGAESQRLRILQTIEKVKAQATQSELQAINNAKTLEAQTAAILRVQERLNAAMAFGASQNKALADSLLLRGGLLSARGGGTIKKAAGGLLPTISQERNSITRGVGGAPASAKPVVIPNFNFGGGKRGTVVANSSEYLVPNFANGGSAVFNQEMVRTMGLPKNAIKLADGYVPNFAKISSKRIRDTLTGKPARELTTENLSTLEFYLDKKRNALGIETLDSKKRGEGFLLFNRLTQIARKSGKSIYSATLLPQSDVKFNPERSNFDNLALNFPPIRYRDQVGLKASGNIRLGPISRPDFETNFASIQNLKRFLDLIPKSKFREYISQKSIDIGQITTTPLAKGYIPNFASSPLAEAVSREVKAGVPLSQIYVDKDPRVKSTKNPLGLLIANKKDEPYGGRQGVDRIIRLGGDPRFAGLATGFVPNFVDELTRPQPFSSTFAESITRGLTPKGLREFRGNTRQTQAISNEKLEKLNKIFVEYKSAVEQGSKERIKFIKQDVQNLRLTQESSRAVMILFEDYAKQAETERRRQFEIQKRTSENLKKEEAEQFKSAQTAANARRGAEKAKIIDDNARKIPYSRIEEIRASRQTTGSSALASSTGIKSTSELQKEAEARSQLQAIGVSRRVQDAVKTLRGGRALDDKTVKFLVSQSKAEALKDPFFKGLTQKEIYQSPDLKALLRAKQQDILNPITNAQLLLRENRAQSLATKIGAARQTKILGTLGSVGLFGSEKGELEKLRNAGIFSKKPGIDIQQLLSQRQQERSQRIANAALLASFGASFLSGFIPRGTSGQASGVASGLTSGVLQGGASGATIGSFFGPKGTLVGAGIGALGGGLFGAFSRLIKSAEELNEEIQKGIATRSKENDEIQRLAQLIEAINDARAEGNTTVEQRLEKQIEALTTFNPVNQAFFNKFATNPLGAAKAAGETDATTFNKNNFETIKQDLLIGDLSDKNIALGIANALQQKGIDLNKLGSFSEIQKILKPIRDSGERGSSTSARLIEEELLKPLQDSLKTTFELSKDLSPDRLLQLLKQFPELIKAIDLNTKNTKEREALRKEQKPRLDENRRVLENLSVSKSLSLIGLQGTQQRLQLASPFLGQSQSNVANIGLSAAIERGKIQSDFSSIILKTLSQSKEFLAEGGSEKLKALSGQSIESIQNQYGDILKINEDYIKAQKAYNAALEENKKQLSEAAKTEEFRRNINKFTSFGSLGAFGISENALQYSALSSRPAIGQQKNLRDESALNVINELESLMGGDLSPELIGLRNKLTVERGESGAKNFAAQLLSGYGLRTRGENGQLFSSNTYSQMLRNVAGQTSDPAKRAILQGAQSALDEKQRLLKENPSIKDYTAKFDITINSNATTEADKNIQAQIEEIFQKGIASIQQQIDDLKKSKESGVPTPPKQTYTVTTKDSKGRPLITKKTVSSPPIYQDEAVPMPGI